MARDQVLSPALGPAALGPAALQHTADLPHGLALWDSLRNSVEFDAWCCEQEGQVFELVRLAEEGGRVEREHRVCSRDSPLPYAVRALLGDEKLSLVTSTAWWRHDHDEDHPMTSATTVDTPRSLRGRVTIRGAQWVEEIAGGLRVHTTMTITVSVAALGHTIASLLLRRAKRNLDTLPELVESYCLSHGTPVAKPRGTIRFADENTPPARSRRRRPPPSASPTRRLEFSPELDVLPELPDADAPSCSPIPDAYEASPYASGGDSPAFHMRRRCELCHVYFYIRGRHHCRRCGVTCCAAHFVRPLCLPCDTIEGDAQFMQTPSRQSDYEPAPAAPLTVSPLSAESISEKHAAGAETVAQLQLPWAATPGAADALLDKHKLADAEPYVKDAPPLADAWQLDAPETIALASTMLVSLALIAGNALSPQSCGAFSIPSPSPPLVVLLESLSAAALAWTFGYLSGRQSLASTATL